MLFLYNPTAGKGRVTADLAAVLDVFTKAGYLTTVYPTQGKADATAIAARAGRASSTGWSAPAGTARSARRCPA